MEDNKPGGAPPDSPSKPKPISNSNPSFSFSQLEFVDAFTLDNRKYLRFFVMHPENACYVDMVFGEYMDLLHAYTDLLITSDPESCSCDLISPDFEDLGNSITETVIYVGEDKVEKEETFEYKCYYVYNLCEKLTFGIHGKH